MKTEKGLSILALIFSIFALVQTQDLKSGSPAPAPDEMSRVNDLDKRIVSIEKDLLELNSERFDRLLNENTSAGFQTSSQEFRLLKTDFGNLLVSLQNAEKFGDGYKLTFHVGNPTNMTISGVEGIIQWSPAIVKGMNYEQFKEKVESRTSSKSFKVSDDIYAGTWNPVTISVGPANEETIGHIVLKDIKTSSIKMRVGRSRP